MDIFISSSLQALLPTIMIVIGGIITWFLKSRAEELRAIEEQLRQQRVRIYKEILTPFVIAFTDPKGGGQEKARRKILSIEYKSTSFELVLLGDDKVIRSWNTLLQYGYAHEEDGGDPREKLRLLGLFLKEIRKSLGSKHTKLTEWDMLRWLVTDIDRIEKG